jgi:nucleotide-binding universal stress UspA family protein
MRTTASERPIVVGVDGSEEGAEALRWAADEARLRRRPLRLVHAVDLRAVDLAQVTPAVGLNPEFTAAARRTAQDVLDRAVAQARGCAAEVYVDPVTEDGRAPAVLLAQTAHAELLVLGSRGRGGFSGMLLGSTSLQVAMHAHCPVIVLRSGAAGQTTGPSAGRVVVGTDGSRHSEAALGLAFEEADLRGLGVTAVRTWLGPDIDVEATPMHEWEQAEKDEQARLAEDLQAWRTRFPGVGLVERTVRGAPAAALIAQSEGAALVAVGSHGRGGFGGLALGSVSHAVLHHAHCPVAVARV